jgi:leucine dehydrogenase
MEVFDSMGISTHEQLVFCSDPSVGLRAIIAIHDTTLGPSIGGTRMWTYASEDDALNDALRLSRGMTYKAAAAGLNFGGGKAVIIGDPRTEKTEALFRSFGRFVEGLGGRYITAEDVGTTVRDMEWVRIETRYVTGLSRALGGSGDPSPLTALGVYRGMKACAKFLLGSSLLDGLKIAVQGLGHVGYYLVKHLYEEGAEVYAADIDEERVNRVVDEFGAVRVKPDDIYEVDADVFSPCALGGILNAETIPKLRCKIIAGSANNQLADEKENGALLQEREILYCPDYVINSGGLINVANELEGYNQERAIKQVSRIYEIVAGIMDRSQKLNVPTYEAANKMAEERIQQIGELRHIYTES